MVFGHVPSTTRATTRRNVFRIVNSNSDSDQGVHIFMPWELPEFTWKYIRNLPEIAHEHLLEPWP
jgi:hypothetical protein